MRARRLLFSFSLVKKKWIFQLVFFFSNVHFSCNLLLPCVLSPLRGDQLAHGSQTCFNRLQLTLQLTAVEETRGLDCSRVSILADCSVGGARARSTRAQTAAISTYK